MKSADRIVELGGWRFYLAGEAEHPALSPDEMVAQALSAVGGKAGRLVRKSRNAASYRVKLNTGLLRGAELFIKLIDPARGLARVKTMIRGSRAAHVARVTRQLNHAGFSAPPVHVHGREVSSGRELVVMSVVHGDGPFRALEAPLGHKRAMLRALGSEIARLHRAGFIHGDLTPYNMFVERGEPPRFTFVDHERTRLTFLAGRRRQLRNLVQLGRFDLPGLTRTDRMRVLRAYAGVQARASWRSLRRRGAAMLQRRIERDGLEPARRV
jgi:Lipopolysaccharide kinase (Kdo/WaaP) family